MGKRIGKSRLIKIGANNTQNIDYNQIKKYFNKKNNNIREVLDNKTIIEDNIKDYLENKKYNVYLSRVNFPLRISIITSPRILKPDLYDLKETFGLTDYDLETEITENIGQYYFK